MQLYNKRIILGNCHSGVAYQRDLTSVIMLGAAELIQDGNALEFTVTCEDLAGGAFDDIGFRFKTESGISKTLYIQAKYTQNEKKQVSWRMLKSKCKNTPFAMIEYYDSFCSIIKQNNDESKPLTITTKHTQNKKKIVSWKILTTRHKKAPSVKSKYYYSGRSTSKQNAAKNMSKNGKQLRQAIENLGLILVLCTNRSLQVEVKNSMTNARCIGKELKHIFGLFSAQLYKFKQRKDVERKRLINLLIQQGNPKMMISLFLGTFIFACKTMNNEMLKGKVKELLKILSSKSLDLTLTDNTTDALYIEWVDFVSKWIYDKQGKPLNENDIKLYFIHYSLMFYSNKYELDISNKKEQHSKIVEKEWETKELYKKLKHWFMEGKKPEIVDWQENTYMVLQIVEKFKTQEQHLLKTHLFLSSSNFIKFKDHVLKLFYDIDQPIFLAIDCTDIEECNVESRYVCKKNGHAKVMMKIGREKNSHLKSENS